MKVWETPLRLQEQSLYLLLARKMRSFLLAVAMLCDESLMIVTCGSVSLLKMQKVRQEVVRMLFKENFTY
jgi:hypothetical protein